MQEPLASLWKHEEIFLLVWGQLLAVNQIMLCT